VTVELAIFDFDGTLADSLPWLVDMTERIADFYGFEKLHRGELETLRQFDARRLLSRYGIPIWRVPFIARRARMLMQRDFAAIKPVHGIQTALRWRGVSSSKS
jgi:phosphoglycolate phosphatase